MFKFHPSHYCFVANYKKLPDYFTVGIRQCVMISMKKSLCSNNWPLDIFPNKLIPIHNTGRKAYKDQISQIRLTTNICYGKIIYFVLVVDGNRVGRHFERHKFLLSVIVLRESFLRSRQTYLLLILELIFLFLPRRKKNPRRGRLIRTINARN